ncbi:MAG: GlsB/YeaQ/YmgE family stress response membrane protein [Pyrinomonadaceae bacterium]
MLHIIGQLIVGLIIGVIARFLIPGKEPIAAGVMGWLVTAGVGMGGSLLGTFVGRTIWKDQGYKAGWILSILGAIGLLLLIRFLF